MSGKSLEPLQQAVYGVLMGDSALMAIVTGVYDLVPESAALPYLAFERSSARDASSFGAPAERVSMELVAYSREGGRKRALDIHERVHALLDRQSPALAGGQSIVWMRIEQTRVQLLGDGITWRAIASLVALVE